MPERGNKQALYASLSSARKQRPASQSYCGRHKRKNASSRLSRSVAIGALYSGSSLAYCGTVPRAALLPRKLTMLRLPLRQRQFRKSFQRLSCSLLVLTPALLPGCPRRENALKHRHPFKGLFPMHPEREGDTPLMSYLPAG